MSGSAIPKVILIIEMANKVMIGRYLISKCFLFCNLDWILVFKFNEIPQDV